MKGNMSIESGTYLDKSLVRLLFPHLAINATTKFAIAAFRRISIESTVTPSLFNCRRFSISSFQHYGTTGLWDIMPPTCIIKASPAVLVTGRQSSSTPATGHHLRPVKSDE
jgi:hypothetical protein